MHRAAQIGTEYGNKWFPKWLPKFGCNTMQLFGYLVMTVSDNLTPDEIAALSLDERWALLQEMAVQPDDECNGELFVRLLGFDGIKKRPQTQQ